MVVLRSTLSWALRPVVAGAVAEVQDPPEEQRHSVHVFLPQSGLGLAVVVGVRIQVSLGYCGDM